MTAAGDSLSRRPDAIALGGLALLALVFWSPWLCGGRVPMPADQQSWMLPWVAEQAPVAKPAQWDALWWDGVAQFYPWRVLLNRWMSRGEWPLWSPNQFCGYPFVGNGQSALFYPPNWLYAVVHPRVGLALVAALHSLIALLLSFAFCRAVGLSRLGAAYTGLAYAFGGFMLGWTPLPTLVNCAAWLPGCLLGGELCVRRSDRRGVIVLGICAAMPLLAGHAQIAAYVLVATAVYAAARMAWEARRRRPVRLGRLCVAGALALLLGSVQVLPLLELGRMSSRGGGRATYEAFLNFHLPRALQPHELVTLVAPDALGSPARNSYVGALLVPGAAYGERCGYVGTMTLVLGLLGVILGKGPLRWGLLMAAALALWATMGGLPALALYFGVPKLGLTGGFVRLMVVYTFFSAALGGWGLDVVLRHLAAAKAGSLPRLVPQVAFLALLAIVGELFTWGWRTVPAASPPRSGFRAEMQRAGLSPGDRILAVTPRAAWGLNSRPEAVLPPNTETTDDLESVQGYDSLLPANYWQFATWVEGEIPAPVANGNMMLLENATSPLLDLAGMRWVITTDPPFPSSGDATESPSSRVRVSRNPRAFPRAFLTDRPVEGGEATLRSLAALPAQQRRSVAGDFGADPNRLELSLPPLDRPQTLVVTNTYFPGWRAWVGSQPAAVTPVGETFQGVRLDAGGQASLLLAYVPATVIVGLFLSLLGAGTLVGLVAFESVRTR